MSQMKPTSQNPDPLNQLKQQLETFQTHFKNSFRGTKDTSDINLRMNKLIAEFQSILEGSQPTSASSKKTLFEKKIGRNFRQITRGSVLADNIKRVKNILPHQLEEIYLQTSNSPKCKLTADQKSLVEGTIQALKGTDTTTKPSPAKPQERARAQTAPARLPSHRKELMEEEMKIYDNLIQIVQDASPEQIPTLVSLHIMNTTISWIDNDKIYKNLEKNVLDIQKVRIFLTRAKNKVHPTKQHLVSMRRNTEKTENKLKELRAALLKLKDPSEFPPDSFMRETLEAARQKLNTKIKRAEKALKDCQKKEKAAKTAVQTAREIASKKTKLWTEELNALQSRSQVLAQKLTDLFMEERVTLKNKLE